MENRSDNSISCAKPRPKRLFPELNVACMQYSFCDIALLRKSLNEDILANWTVNCRSSQTLYYMLRRCFLHVFQFSLQLLIGFFLQRDMLLLWTAHNVDVAFLFAISFNTNIFIIIIRGIILSSRWTFMVEIWRRRRWFIIANWAVIVSVDYNWFLDWILVIARSWCSCKHEWRSGTWLWCFVSFRSSRTYNYVVARGCDTTTRSTHAGRRCGGGGIWIEWRWV